MGGVTAIKSVRSACTDDPAFRRNNHIILAGIHDDEIGGASGPERVGYEGGWLSPIQKKVVRPPHALFHNKPVFM
jgi:hypothetical protein